MINLKPDSQQNNRPALPERALLLRDTIDFFTKARQGNVHKWLFSVPQSGTDKVRGSFFWDALYRSEPYYLPSYETEIIHQFSDSVEKLPLVRGILNNRKTIFDLGPGSEDCVEKKTIPVIRHAARNAVYRPVDVSPEFVGAAIRGVNRHLPSLQCVPLLGDFENPPAHSEDSGLVLFFGSTMFNVITPAGRKKIPVRELALQLDILKRYAQDGYLIVTQDTTQDEKALFDAYCTPAHIGMTENFTWRIQRDLAPGGYFNPEAWAYEPSWNPAYFQFAHGLKATEDQKFSLDGARISVKKGDVFITHNSYKIPRHIFSEISYAAGFRTLQTFSNDRFVLHMMRMKPFME